MQGEREVFQSLVGWRGGGGVLRSLVCLQGGLDVGGNEWGADRDGCLSATVNPWMFP